MASKRGSTEPPFADVHLISGYIEKRLRQLQSNEPIGAGILVERPERDAILAFVRARRPEVSEVRIRTFLSWLPLAAARLGPQFLTPDRETPTAFSEAFPPREYARGTRATGANCLCSFWRWWLASQGKEYPSWLRLRLEKWKSTTGPSDMLTREEVTQIAEHALNFRDKAWIWTLFNSGCRPGEVYQLRVGDVTPHDEGYIELRVRREKNSAPEPAPVYEDAVPALLSWLGAHPQREDPDAPLWVDLRGARSAKGATYRAMYKALESAAARAKIAKPVTPYALRRSRLTILAKDPAISTSILEKVAGWVPGSNVARHYVHLSGKDVLNALNTRYGVKAPSPEDRVQASRAPVKCARCKTVNPAGAAFCMNCGGPLSLPAVKQIEEARGAEERLADLLGQPEAVEFLARLLAEREGDKSRIGRQAGSGAGGYPLVGEPADYGQHSLESRAGAQRVVTLAEAERLIGSGFEFVGPLGTSKAIVRNPSNSPGH